MMQLKGSPGGQLGTQVSLGGEIEHFLSVTQKVILRFISFISAKLSL